MKLLQASFPPMEKAPTTNWDKFIEDMKDLG